MGANAQTSVPTFTAGDVLTAANMNISARTGVPVFADTTARDAGFGGTGEKVLAEGQLCYVENLTGIAQLQYYDGASWISFGNITNDTAEVTTAQTTTSTSYTDLATVGPSVTVTTGTKALVMVTCQVENSGGAAAFMSYAVSGATTIAAADTTAVGNKSTSFIRATACSIVTLTAGSNTFTAKYKVGASTGTFERRTIAVINLGS